MEAVAKDWIEKGKVMMNGPTKIRAKRAGTFALSRAIKRTSEIWREKFWQLRGTWILDTIVSRHHATNLNKYGCQICTKRANTAKQQWKFQSIFKKPLMG